LTRTMKESDAMNRSSMKEIVASRSGEKRASTSGEGLDRSFNDEQKEWAYVTEIESFFLGPPHVCLDPP